MTSLDITDCDGGVVIRVKVVPGASKTTIVGEMDGMLKIKVSAAPQKGKANQCLIEFLSKRLGLRKNALSIVSGRTNPVKRVRICGLTAEDVMSELMRSG